MKKNKPEPEPVEVLKPPFKRSVEHERLFDYLAPLNIAAEVSYETIRGIIDEDPQAGAGYAIVKGVRDRLIKEGGAVWYPLPGFGLRRANPEETLEIIEAGIHSARRKNARNGRVVNAAAKDYSKLDDEHKKEFNFLTSVVGALGMFFARPQQKKLQAATEDKAIDSKSVLKIFSGE
jgi:hypothetical protein